MSGTTLPTVFTSAGLQPQAPADLLAQLIALVTATNPGYTANLPGALVEDVSSTDVAAISLCDQARVDLVNSLNPRTANPFILTQLGQIYGVQLGVGSNTSVNVVFSGSAGFVIQPGFTVSDGSHQYVVQDGGIIGTDGTSQQLFCLATQSGSWAVGANTVNQIATAVPSGVTLTVNNPQAGTPGLTAQTEADYRSQVIQAGLSSAQGMSAFLRTQIENVSGVQARLVSIRAIVGGGWEIIVGGGDPYQVAGAIYRGLFDVSTLVGSTMAIDGITNANPGVVTTVLNHGYSNGQQVTIAGVLGMTGVNGGPYTVTVADEKNFSIGINTTSFGAYTSGGVLTPNLRNQSVTITDYPDTYVIPFVLPPQQSVFIGVLWNTTATNVVSPVAVASLASPALVDYVNGIPVGQPMNLFELQATFQQAVASILPTPLLTRMIFSVSINGIGVSPEAGTGIIAGDPESYFLTSSTSISIAQG